MRLSCTGTVSADGFPAFLEQELGEPRRNLQLLATELRSWLPAPHLTLVNSGSAANLAAALWLRERASTRRRVLLAGFSFPTTVSAFALLGFEVVLVDVQPGGFNMDPAALFPVLDDRVAAVVVTHFLGFPARLAEIEAQAEAHGALLIQDACETMGLTCDGRPIHAFGNILTHSFYHPHHLSAYGGGAVATRTLADADLVESLVHWGRACRCHYDPAGCPVPPGIAHQFTYQHLGINAEMSELNAAFGRFQLRSWAGQEAARRLRYGIWHAALTDIPGVRIWDAPADVSPFVFPICLTPSRAARVAAAFRDAGIEVRSLMGGAIHAQPAFAHLRHPALRACEQVGASCFFVGIHQTLPETDVSWGAAQAQAILRGNGNVR